MRSRIFGAPLRIRPIALITAATCFIPTLVISDASQQTASARMMMGERPAMGHAPRMGGGRMHGGGPRMHGHRGGGYRGFSGGSALGLGLAVGGMVIDQVQRAQDRDYDDEPRDAPARRHVDKPRNTTSVSKPKKKDPPAVARKKKDEPVPAKGKSDTFYAKKQDTPYSGGGKKDEPRSGRRDPRDVPVSRDRDPRDVPVASDDPRDVPVAYDDPRDKPVPTSTTTRDPGLAPPEYPTGRPPRPPEYRPPRPPSLVSNPVPVFPAPPPPAMQCKDCRELEQWIERLKSQIEADKQKKQDSEKKLEEREREVEQLKGKLRRAKNPIWRDYYQQRIDSIEDYIKEIKKLDTRLQELIDEQEDQLAELIALYEACADPQCREQVTDVPQPPNNPGPAPEEPKDTPVAGGPRDEPKDTPLPPTPTSSTQANACPDHWAELTNSKRVFHRLYVMGTANNDWERTNWPTFRDNVKAGLEGPGRQAPQSTSRDMNEPTLAEFRSEMQRLADVVQPCEEVTLYLLGHGGGGNTNGWDLPALTPNGETKAEFFSLKKTYDKKTGQLIFSEYQGLFDRDLGEMIKKFKPNVSVTVLLSSCWGGGFAGKGNVEESKLVKLIGLYMQCYPGSWNKEIRKGVDDLAGKSEDGRVTAIQLKDHLLHKGWPLGEPFDSPLDNYVNERLGEYLPR